MMKSKPLLKIAVGAGLMSVSVLSFAAAACCGDLACCLENLMACCF